MLTWFQWSHTATKLDLRDERDSATSVPGLFDGQEMLCVLAKEQSQMRAFTENFLWQFSGFY